MAKEKGLDRLLVDDWYLRRPLTDHFLGEGTTLENFMSGKYYELGDFILEPFAASWTENEDAFNIILTRNGHVWHRDFHCPMNLKKIITFPKKGNTIGIEYRLLQNSLEIMPVVFGVEFDFNLLAPDAEDRYTEIDGLRPPAPALGATAETSQASTVSYIDEYQKLGIRLNCDLAAKIWRSPIHTVSLSEGGFEKVFQGNCTMFIFEKALSAGQELRIKFDLFAGPLEKMPAYISPKRIAANSR